LVIWVFNFDLNESKILQEINLTGLIGAILKYITPLTIAPTVALIGLSLFDAAAREASGNWWIAARYFILIVSTNN
jgi:solute carrier family 23 (nucleobase transporter), member 1